MIVFRRRLLFWLIREYLKKWGKTIIACFFVGLLAFYSIRSHYSLILAKIPTSRKESIGIVGSYTLDNLPSDIARELSRGLTMVAPDGKPLPDVAKSWDIRDNGKTYVFHLQQDVYFTDGTKMTSDLGLYNFYDVKIKRPDKETIVFTLRDVYSPFLVKISRPIFKNGYVGIGKYKIIDVKLNGSFIESLTIASVANPREIKVYQFYPSVLSLKVAYAIGEIGKAIGLPNTSFKDVLFDTFPNTKVEKKVNYNQLSTLFYNTRDSRLSDKKIRLALSYALPDEFTDGKRVFSPYAPHSWAYTDQFVYSEDVSRAKILLSNSEATKSATLALEIKTMPRYKKTAESIANEWKKIGVATKIQNVDSVPQVFQIFLGDFFLSMDPDQYTLWHSGQENNITGFDNKRIDKLLEDGRKTIDMNERREIYTDFQKYFLAEAPAAFLYFPYEYDVSRK